MMRAARLLGLSVLAVSVLTSMADAALAAEEVEVALNEEYVPATSVNFEEALQTGSDSLRTLGSRIEDARQNADPVGLAGAAVVLAAMEKATGKQASITADSLLADAVETAILRNASVELKAIASLVDCDDTKQKLAKEIAKAQKREAEAAAVLESGEHSRGVHVLHIDNHTNHEVCVHYNGRELGDIPAHTCGEFHPNDHSHAFDIKIFGGGRRWHNHYHGQWQEKRLVIH